MLDHFLDVALRNETTKNQTVKLAQDLKRLPNETLYKIASGELKLSYGHADDWIEKYKGTPLFDQALALERAELENEIARSQAQAAQPEMDQFWRTQDQIRVQKKMLDLHLVEVMEGQGMKTLPGGQLPEQVAPADSAQGAGAPGDMAPEGAQDGAPGKMAAATKEALSTGLIKKVIGEGAKRGLSQGHLDRLNNLAGNLVSRGAQMAGNKTVGPGNAGLKLLQQGATLHDALPKLSSAEARFVKAALDIGALGKGALELAKKNPAAVGAGIGAVGGALTAPRDAQGNKHMLSGAVTGGLLGAGAGHAAGGISARMGAGKGFVDAAKGYGQDALATAGQKMREAKSRLVPTAQPQVGAG